MAEFEFWLCAAVPPAVAVLCGGGAGAGASALGAASGAVAASALPPAWRYGPQALPYHRPSTQLPRPERSAANPEMSCHAEIVARIFVFDQ